MASCLGRQLGATVRGAGAENAKVSQIYLSFMSIVMGGFLAYFLVLGCWQRMRQALHRTQTIFLDKLCIAQHDEALKEKGILGLAAFLHRSDKLLVLWSPRYFARLWCVYEIATFMKDRHRAKSILFIPVKMASLFFLYSASWHVLTYCYYMVDDAADGRSLLQQTVIVAPVFATICAIVIPCAYALGIGMMKDVEELPAQLRSFDVRRAACACCTFPQHLHPETGRGIPCDRALVLRMLHKWYGSPDQDEDGYLEQFNSLVRCELAPQILGQVNRTPCYSFYVVAAPNVPFLAYYIPRWFQLAPAGASFTHLAVWALRHLMGWAILTLVALFSVRVSMFLWQVGLSLSLKRSRLLVSAALVPGAFRDRSLKAISPNFPVMLVLGASAWLPFQITFAVTEEDDILPIIPFGVLVVIVLYLYRPARGMTADEAPPQVAGNLVLPVNVQKEDLAPELLRGVPLHVALSGWAKHWGSPDSGRFGSEATSYELSVPCAHFGYFLSHDWGTPRFQKLLCLLIVFNSRAALLASLAASACVGFLEAWVGLPMNLWTPCIGFLAYFLVLGFWQRMRQVLHRTQTVFLDKLCIAQHDEALKEKGILGLAAFLHRSDKLLVLWSPRYFARLWCAYEIATFMKDRQRAKSILVMPVKMASLLFLYSASWHVLTYCYYMVDDAADGRSLLQQTVIVGPVFAAICAIVIPSVYALGIGMMKDVEELPAQLRSFDVCRAACSCCTFPQHRHPETGRRIPCDRVLVLRMLHKWYGSPDQDEDGYLQQFNSLVRCELAPQILRRVGSDTMPLSYSFYVVAAPNVPFLAYYIPRWFQQAPAGESFTHLAVWALRRLMGWAVLTLVALFSVRVSMFLWKVGLSLSVKRSRLLVSAALVPVMLVLGTCAWLPFQLAFAATEEDDILPIIPFSLLVVTAL
ncbi:ABCF5 [Symbiodinium natans]|uniref:ABCF5 protein n=1 Tax=Symbiodinium natans TaxID=878477 RepID=A0A812IJQ4_9DINO|nr:ABCF5 [Symbiodinium natans]